MGERHGLPDSTVPVVEYLAKKSPAFYSDLIKLAGHPNQVTGLNDGLDELIKRGIVRKQQLDDHPVPGYSLDEAALSNSSPELYGNVVRKD